MKLQVKVKVVKEVKFVVKKIEDVLKVSVIIVIFFFFIGLLLFYLIMLKYFLFLYNK